jgi:DNA-binding response OmpR family regulator
MGSPGVFNLVAMQTRSKVLVVEDEPAWADIVADALTQAGYVVRAVADAAAARGAMAEAPEVAIVDIALDGDDGLVLCAELKELAPDMQILVCSASKRRADRLLSLRLADAFLAKPCDLDELVARLEVLARRPAAPAVAVDAELRVGDMLVHRRRAEVLRGERSVVLTPAEHRLLVLLAERAGQVVPRPEAAERVQGHKEATSGRALDMLAARLRGKLEQLGDGAPVLNSVRGFGLQLAPPE